MVGGAGKDRRRPVAPGTGAPRNRLRSVLVVAEVALAMVLLVGGGLMIKSLWRLSHVSLGYEPQGVLTAKIDPSGARYAEDLVYLSILHIRQALANLLRDLRSRLASVRVSCASICVAVTHEAKQKPSYSK